MRTTIDIPDALFRRAKFTAFQRHQSLKQLLTEVIDSAFPDEASASRRLDSPPINQRLSTPIPAFSNKVAAEMVNDAEAEKFE